MKKTLGLSLLMIILTALLAGCSHTIHKREADKNDPSDKGSETRFELRGPRAVLQHKF